MLPLCSLKYKPGMSRVTPVRRIKEGNKGTFYEAKVRCGTLKIFIADDEDYPVRLTAQYTGSGGCESNLQAVQRLITLLLECNVRYDCIIEQLNKIVCPSCKAAFIKGDTQIAFSCAKAIAGALEKHMANGDKKE